MSSILAPSGNPRPARRRAAAAAVLLLLMPAGCATKARTGTGGSTVITVVAAENFWGSLAQQLGGAYVKVTSIINNPDADPHDYEPTAADGRLIAAAQLAIITRRPTRPTRPSSTRNTTRCCPPTSRPTST